MGLGLDIWMRLDLELQMGLGLDIGMGAWLGQMHGPWKTIPDVHS